MTKFCIRIIIDKIYVGIVNFCFSQICNRVTALDSCQNLVFTQSIENEWTEYFIGKIYVGNVNRCFRKFSTELQPLIHAKICYCLLNILRTNVQILNKFCIHIIIDKIYVGIVNRCFAQICNRVTAVDLRQNLVYAPYEWNQILYTHYQ